MLKLINYILWTCLLLSFFFLLKKANLYIESKNKTTTIKNLLKKENGNLNQTLKNIESWRKENEYISNGTWYPTFDKTTMNDSIDDDLYRSLVIENNNINDKIGVQLFEDCMISKTEFKKDIISNNIVLGSTVNRYRQWRTELKVNSIKIKSKHFNEINIPKTDELNIQLKLLDVNEISGKMDTTILKRIIKL